MKRMTRLLLLLLVLLLPGTFPAAAEGHNKAEEFELIFSNRNEYATDNGPKYEAEFTVNHEVYLQVLTTVHWNYGRGQMPGSISLWEDGKSLGSWRALSREEDGVKYVLWDVFPQVTLQPGHVYRVVDSNYTTWTTNAQANYKGFYELRGVRQGDEDPEDAGEPAAASEPAPLLCDAWAEPELRRAEAAGLVPTALEGADLREPITRQEFAGVCVLGWTALSPERFEAPEVLPNPFTDTQDPAVLLAYDLGIARGTSETTFSPMEFLTREQGAVMLDRLLRNRLGEDILAALEDPVPFADSGLVSGWAAESVGRMAAAGLLRGSEDHFFSPQNPLSRQEALIVALRMVETYRAA